MPRCDDFPTHHIQQRDKSREKTMDHNNTFPWLDNCPCLQDEQQHRILEDNEEVDPPVWQTVVVSLTVAIMFYFMLTDKIGPDWVMFSGLMLFMVTEIITISDGLAGFKNEGILTVLVLFVVAEGISRTGALDYYMGLIMGKPKTIAGAQLRLMIPIATLSAFLNNTPIVAVMIPLTLRWAKTIGVPRQQLLIPLSYATILGGTCTLVGTSTNLVVSGLLDEDYPDEPSGNIGLFELAKYGVPNAIIGLAYMMAASSYLLPHGGGSTNSEVDDLLLGARVMPWSPAAGRTVKRSGLGSSGGIYLVSVRRAATGNIHHAVSKDFVISVGDELYFTASVEEFGDFCEKHGLEVITTENVSAYSDKIAVPSDDVFTMHSDEAERLRLINHMSDQIGGREPADAEDTPTRVIVTTSNNERTVLVGVNCLDRPGLLMDISTSLYENGLVLRHSEAKVLGDRSLSVWRCETLDSSTSDLQKVWNNLSTLLKTSDQSTVSKKTGTRVLRAYITKSSSLLGKKPVEVDFRGTYKAAVVAYQKNGKNSTMEDKFSEGDLLVLQTMEGSPLMEKPPRGFYEKQKTRRSILGTSSRTEDPSEHENDVEGSDRTLLAWKDLKVVFEENDNNGASILEKPQGEFLTAFIVTPKSPLENKSLNELGYGKLPGVVLISIERPQKDSDLKHDVSGEHQNRFTAITADDPLHAGDVFWFSGSAEAIGDLRRVHGLVFYQEEEMKVVSSLQERRLVQAVVARGSPLIGQTIKDVHFRSQYGGAVIAIQRGSERVHEHPGNVKLQTGDVLLVEAGPSFVKKHGSDYRTFALLSEVENSAPPRPRLFLLCTAMIAASLIVSSLEYTSLLVSAGIVGIIMVSLGVLTQQEARDAVQWDLYVVVGAAFGVGTAMEKSGVAKGLAKFLVRVGQSLGIGDAGIYGSVYLASNLMSAVLTNNAAATLMYPIAMQAVDQTNADRLKMSFILMLSASDYITSFGYQTNLMVYGPGGYSNMDFMKFGSIMQILLWLSSTAMVSASTSRWYISWFICAIGLAVVSAVRLTNGAILRRNKGTDEVVKDCKSWHFDFISRKSAAESHGSSGHVSEYEA